MARHNAASKIIGTGHYVPPKVVTNDDLAQMFDTSDEWIQQRTGIKERRIAAAYERTSVASLRGREWIRWLNESGGRELFAADAADALDRLAYGGVALPSNELEPLLAASREWVRSHRA